MVKYLRRGGGQAGALVLAAVAVVVLGGVALPSSVASAAGPVPVSPRAVASVAPGVYHYNANSGKCLSPAGGGVANNTATVIYNCDTDPSRVWAYVDKGNGLYQVLNIQSRKCLSPAGGGVANNTTTVIYTCDENPARLWYFADYKMVNYNSGKCLSPAGGGVANNTTTVIYNCDTDPSRTWWGTFG